MKKLFGHHDSGHAYKVKLFLDVADIHHEYEWVDIWQERDQRSAEFQAVARYGEVPVLLDNGQAYVQSNAILLHLATNAKLWGAETPESLALCREWLVWEANKIGLCLPQLRIHKRFEASASLNAAMPWLLARYEHDIHVMENTFSDGRQWIIGSEQPTVADFCLCGYLFFAEEAEVAVPPGVAKWLQRLSSLSAWKRPYDLLAK